MTPLPEELVIADLSYRATHEAKAYYTGPGALIDLYEMVLDSAVALRQIIDTLTESPPPEGPLPPHFRAARSRADDEFVPQSGETRA